MFKLQVEIVPNPDRGENWQEEQHCFFASTMKELHNQINKFRVDNCIGGGNWGEATLFIKDTIVGYMSYNGRIWKTKYWEDNKAVEVIL